MTYYDILGVPETASFEEIKQAYRAQIKFFHPDVFQENPEIAEIKTQQLNEAYDVLGDQQKRQEYDGNLRWVRQRAAQNTHPTHEDPPRQQAYQTQSRQAEEPRYYPPAKGLDRLPLWLSRVIRLLAPLSAIIVLVLIWSLTPDLSSKSSEQATKEDVPTAEEPIEAALKEEAPQTSRTSELLAKKRAAQEEEAVYFTPTGDKFLDQEHLANGEIPRTVDIPTHGSILYQNGNERIAPFGVETTGGGYYYVKLREVDSKSDVINFFVHAGRSLELNVPLGEYEMVYAFGTVWYGEGLLFGENTVYSRADETFDFTADDTQVYGWTVELYEQYDGNMVTEIITADEF